MRCLGLYHVPCMYYVPMLLTPARVQQLLRDVQHRRLSVREAYERLQMLPYDRLDGALLDTHRAIRRRYPEAVFCEGKTIAQIASIVQRLLPVAQPLLLTRLRPDAFEALAAAHPALHYHAGARMAVANHVAIRRSATPYALVVTAGTSDAPVAEEARVTLEAFGRRVRLLSDVGVAGLHRVMGQLPLIQRAAVIVVVAGMDGALPSVVGGLTSSPVVAVPTSVGYGASFHGIGPLLTMLNTCVPGVVLVNIDNGFGAGYFANVLLDR